MNYQKVKLSYISEEDKCLKDKAEVMSKEQKGKVVSTPLEKVYVFADDMSGDFQLRKHEKTIPVCRLLQESEVNKN